MGMKVSGLGYAKSTYGANNLGMGGNSHNYSKYLVEFLNEGRP